LAGKVEAEAKRLQEIRSDILQETSGKMQANVSKMNAKRQEKIDSRRATVLEKINAGWEISDIAELTEVSERTVKNDIKALNGSVQR
jgi:DNA-binding NarL/FixJ family response regulator